MGLGEIIYIQGTPKNLYWYYAKSGQWPRPFCKTHNIEMQTQGYPNKIKCDDCPSPIQLPSTLRDYIQYVHKKIEGKAIGNFRPVRIDTGGAAILAKETSSELADYFIETKLSDTDGGLQLMIQVGKRDHTGKKVQLFVEPSTKRMNFDRNEKDQHPAGIFAEVKAIFKNASITIRNEKGKN